MLLTKLRLRPAPKPVLPKVSIAPFAVKFLSLRLRFRQPVTPMLLTKLRLRPAPKPVLPRASIAPSVVKSSSNRKSSPSRNILTTKHSALRQPAQKTAMSSESAPTAVTLTLLKRQTLSVMPSQPNGRLTHRQPPISTDRNRTIVHAVLRSAM